MLLVFFFFFLCMSSKKLPIYEIKYGNKLINNYTTFEDPKNLQIICTYLEDSPIFKHISQLLVSMLLEKIGCGVRVKRNNSKK